MPTIQGSKYLRFTFFETRLFWIGYVSRKEMAECLGISPESATLAIREYVKFVPDNVYYDPSGKVYRPVKDFRPRIIAPSPDQVLGHLLLEDNFLSPLPEMLSMPVPMRAIPTETLRTLLSTIAEQQSIDILYRSMSTPEPIWRNVTPHAFGHDGFRWHVRAYCSLRKQFRDFVLGRIVETGDRDNSKIKNEVDGEWEKTVSVRISPHPELNDNQRAAIELDYDMEKGEAVFEVRKAMLFYVLKHMNLHKPEGEIGFPPIEQQIVLVNEEIRDLIKF